MTARSLKDCLILIPARGGSKGIPGKNMALLGGKPLIEYTIRAALDANLPGRICVSTDDEKIKAFCSNFSIDTPFLRPAELARDDSGMIPVVAHALDWYERESGFYPYFIVLLQPTSPFRTPQDIKDAYGYIVSEDAQNLFSVNPVGEHPCEYVVRSAGGFSFVMEPPEKPGRQNFPEVFFINGAIYIATVEFFRKSGALFDNKALLFMMSLRNSIDIDDPEDLEYANWRTKERQQKKQ